MRAQAIFTALLPSIVSAAGTARVINNCPFEVYLYSVPAKSPTEIPIPAGRDYSELFHKGSGDNGGIALKLYREPGKYFTQYPVLNFGYTLDKALVWYDLTAVWGEPFKGFSLSVTPSDTGKATIVWPSGVSPGGSNIQNARSEETLMLILCA